MAAIEDILSGALGKALGGGGDDKSKLLTALMPVIITMLANGGLSKILSGMKGKGLSAQADSWVGKGENLPITGEQPERRRSTSARQVADCGCDHRSGRGAKNERNGGEMAETARDLMSEGCECVEASETVAAAAKKLAKLNVGAMPICGDDDKLKGMLTDRDIAVKVVAEGRDPTQVTAADLAEGVPVTVTAEDPAEDVMRTMAQNQVRRVPVLDADRRLVGIVSQADVATRASANQAGNLVEAISAG